MLKTKSTETQSFCKTYSYQFCFSRDVLSVPSQEDTPGDQEVAPEHGMGADGTDIIYEQNPHGLITTNTSLLAQFLYIPSAVTTIADALTAPHGLLRDLRTLSALAPLLALTSPPMVTIH